MGYDKILNKKSFRVALMDWLVISAALAILMLAWHQDKFIRRMAVSLDSLDKNNALQLKVMQEQINTLNDIHNAVHEEGQRGRK